jgi:hypothetical protein
VWRRGGGGRGRAGAVAAQCDMACALGGRGGWGANSRRKDRGENIWWFIRKGKRGVWKFGEVVETAGKAGGNSCEVGCAQGKKNGRAGSGVGLGRRAVGSN